MKVISMYGPFQLFLSVAVIVLGAHIIILSSMEALPNAYAGVGIMVVTVAVLLAMLNMRMKLK